MPQLFVNNGTTTLAAELATGAGTLSVAPGDGAKFPALSGDDYILLTLTQTGAETSWEIIKATARSGDDFTITRAQEGTSDATWPAGSKVYARLTKASMDRVADAMSPDAFFLASNF